LGVYTIRARTITIDEDGFEFAWSISPAPTRPDLVEDPDSGRLRFEQFVVPIVEWKIRDNSGRVYADWEGSTGGGSESWQTHARYRPAPPPTATALVLTLVLSFTSHEIKNAMGRELKTIRVPLAGEDEQSGGTRGAG
jgi:hypothetical protein